MPGDNSEKPSAPTSDRRTFLKRAGAVAVVSASVLLGNKLGTHNNPPSETDPLIVPGHSPEPNPSPIPTPDSKPENSEESEKIRPIDFPYKNKDELTQAEFFEQFDRMYSEGLKSPDKYWKPDVVYHTQTGEVVFLGKRTRPYPKTKIGDPPPTTEINMLQIAVKKGDYFKRPNYTNRELFQYPGDSEILQQIYELYENHESEKSTEYLKWSDDLSPVRLTEFNGEMSPKELHRLSKTLTEGFNWAVQNDRFYQDPKQPLPRITFPNETKV